MRSVAVQFMIASPGMPRMFRSLCAAIRCRIRVTAVLYVVSDTLLRLAAACLDETTEQPSLIVTLRQIFRVPLNPNAQRP